MTGRLSQVEERKREAAKIQAELDDVITSRDHIYFESTNIGGRLEVISKGVVPTRPDKDRRIALSVVGGLGLAALGVGIVALIGFMDRRMHYIDSARSRLKRVDRMLGVLPELPNDLTDPTEAGEAAYCVHRIRAMLQIRQRSSGHKIYAVTSPAPGDGKTSLTITLGMSLASCGCRTLLVDCDMEGSGLTSRLGQAARRPLGQILLDEGAIGEAKLQDGLELARKTNIKLGKALRQLKHITEATLRQALRQQRNTAPGLGDVLAGGDAEQAVRSTGYPLLSILPLGAAAASHAGKLSPVAIRRLLDQLSANYDVVLLDCGPVLGSIEAAIVSAEVDSVILVVSRGGDRTAAEHAVNLLVSAGAEVEGIVFNRARATDVSGSVFSSSSSARSARTAPPSSHGFDEFSIAAGVNNSRAPDASRTSDSPTSNG
jgi:non-specific protein-tyrosine kinase